MQPESLEAPGNQRPQVPAHLVYNPAIIKGFSKLTDTDHLLYLTFLLMELQISSLDHLTCHSDKWQ